MIVSVGVTAQVTIRIGDFTSKTHNLSWNRLSHEQINVPLLGQSPRFCRVKDEGLHFREWHLVQLLSISKLEGAQCQSCDRAEARHHRLSTSMLCT
jgi:hypothetical protein